MVRLLFGVTAFRRSLCRIGTVYFVYVGPAHVHNQLNHRHLAR